MILTDNMKMLSKTPINIVCFLKDGAIIWMINPKIERPIDRTSHLLNLGKLMGMLRKLPVKNRVIIAYEKMK